MFIDPYWVLALLIGCAWKTGAAYAHRQPQACSPDRGAHLKAFQEYFSPLRFKFHCDELLKQPPDNGLP